MPDENTESNGETTQVDNQGPTGGVPPTFETWFESQPADVKSLVDSHTNGLKSALDSERQQRKDFEKKLRDAAKKLEEGSESRKAIEDMAGKLSSLEQQADFYDAAHQAGATNLRLAFLAAQESGLLDPETGKVDFGDLKKQFPELFGTRTAPPGNAGTGTQDQPTARSMNDFIRTAAGRR